jgi:hypothetical protein
VRGTVQGENDGTSLMTRYHENGLYDIE